jgi:hypothetical protein
MKGKYLIHESRQSGEDSAFATSFDLLVVVGDSDSGTMVLGQYIDHSIAVGGRDARRL